MSLIASEDFHDLVYIHSLSFLCAIDLASFMLSSKSLRSRMDERDVVRWCLTESRRAQLSLLHEKGDLPLTLVNDHTSPRALTFERLHLYENPPRFPCCYYEFGQPCLTEEAASKLQYVAALLFRHKTMKIRVEGRVQRDAPERFKMGLSTQRAQIAAHEILNFLVELLPTGDVLPPSIANDYVSDRIQYVGCGSEPLVNLNFQICDRVDLISATMSERTPESYDIWASEWRRVDITVIDL